MKQTATTSHTFYLIIALFITIPLVFIWGSFNSFTLVKQVFFNIIFGFLAIYIAWIEKPNKIIIPNLFKPLFIIFIISLFSALWSKQQLFSSLNSCLLLFYILLGIFMINFLRKKDFETIIEILLYSTAFISIIGIIQFFFPNFLTPDADVPGKWRVISSFGNPSYLAAFLVGILPLAWQRYSQKKNLENSIFLILPLICLILTFSRASWLSILIIALIWLFAYKKFSLKYFLITTFIAILIISSIAATQPGFKKQLLNFDSLKGRFFLSQMSLLIIKNHWLTGVGLNQFRYHYLDYQYQMLKENPALATTYAPFAPVEEYIHNDFLQIFAELGIFGFTALIFFLYIIFKYLLLFSKKPLSLEFASLLGLLAILINAVFFFPFYLPPTLLLTIFFISIIGLSEKKTTTINFNISIKILLTIIALPTIIISINTLIGDISLENGAQNLNENKLIKSTAYFQKAVKLNPWSGENRYFLAKTYFLSKEYNKAQAEIFKCLQSSRNYYIYTLQVFLYNMNHQKQKANTITNYLETALPGRKLTLKYGLSME